MTPSPCFLTIVQKSLWERGQSPRFQSCRFRSLCVTWDKSMGLSVSSLEEKVTKSRVFFSWEDQPPWAWPDLGTDTLPPHLSESPVELSEQMPGPWGRGHLRLQIWRGKTSLHVPLSWPGHQLYLSACFCTLREGAVGPLGGFLAPHALCGSSSPTWTPVSPAPEAEERCV